MNKKMKKLAAVFMTLAMLLLALPGQILVSYAGTGKITFSDPTASVGNQVSVTMKIASSDQTALGNADVMLEYDASALEFLSGTGANGGAGSIRVVGAMESASQTTFGFTLKFKALKAGTTSITVKSQEVYDADSKAVTIEHVGNSAVKVNAPESSSKDANLGSLTISPGTLSPEFSADVTEYTAEVSGDVDKITVSAPANDSSASVVVEGAEGLQTGENKVVCKVTAEDGETTKTYTITVTKAEGGSGDGGEESSDPGSSSQGPVNVEEGNWQVSDTIDAEGIPDGFTASEFEYGGRTVEAAVNEQGVVLLYMTDENGNGDFFVYDEEADVLAPYVTVRMAEKTIVVLAPENIPEGTELPEGFKECTIDIGEHTVHGWIWNSQSGEAPEYCVVYGQNADGEKNFYRYDQKEMTLQRFFQDPEAEELRETNRKIVEEYNSLVDDYKVRGWMAAGLFGVCIVLLIILIVLLLMRKPKNTYPDRTSGKSRPSRTRTRDSYRAEELEEMMDPDLEFDDQEEPRTRRYQTPGRKRQAESARSETMRTNMRPETVRTEKTRTESTRTEEDRTRTNARPVSRYAGTVEDAERELARGLAEEAKQQTAEKAGSRAEMDQDDDLEFIDLDL